MSSNELKTCAHLPCRCLVPEGQKYCSQSCEDAGSKIVEIECDCGHLLGCGVTAEKDPAA